MAKDSNKKADSTNQITEPKFKMELKAQMIVSTLQYL